MGFGILYAITSGYLAALSIIENKSYKKLIKKNLSGKMKKSVVNRFYTEKVGGAAYNYIFKEAKRNHDRWIDMLHESYNLSLRDRFLYPYAKLYISKKIRDFQKNY